MVTLEKSITEMLPQIPYVIDQVGEALKWVKEETTDGAYNKALEVAYEVAEYAKSVSDPNFYKTHLVVASILSSIEDASEKERFSTFDTASKATEKSLKALYVSTESITKYGCFKAVLMHLVPLAKENEDLFAVALIGVKHDLQEILKGMEKANMKTPITSEDYITVLGYSYVMANIRMAKVSMLDKARKIYNDIEIMLNSVSY